MLSTILQLLLLTSAVRLEPSVIDSLTIQLPVLSENDGNQSISPPNLPQGPMEDSLQQRPENLHINTPLKSTTATTASPAADPPIPAPPPRQLPPIPAHESSLTDQSGKTSANPSCPSIFCFIMTLHNGTKIFDCAHELPRNGMVTHQLDCNYWQPPSTSLIPITAKFFNNGGKAVMNTANHPEPLRVVLKPRTDNPNLRIAADAMVPGALTRLVEAVREHVRPPPTTQIKLSLIMVKIKRMTYEDLARVFTVANLSGLNLWNPDHLEETSFLQDVSKVSALAEVYVRLNFYCETENDHPAFGRLWLPWLRWQVKFLHCRGHYSCYRWPREERLCCNPQRCPETPGYVITHADKLASRDPAVSHVHQQQILDFYSCETESDLTNPLVELRKRDNCWAIPGYGLLDTTLRPTEATTTTVAWQTPTRPASTPTPLSPSLKQQPSDDGNIDRLRMRNLIIGIVCLLILNLITFCCFVIACCWAWKKLGDAQSRLQQNSNDVAGTYVPKETFEKSDYRHYDDDFWWPRFYLHDDVEKPPSELAPTPLFARNAMQGSYEHTPIMGSRDALLPALSTPGLPRVVDGLPPPPTRKSTGCANLGVRRDNDSFRSRHTLVIEGDSTMRSPVFPQIQNV
uniref:Uncharacterized protein n=1 Tax=Mesocestoides corti TaxID=53468 RepID=A0A5K3F2M1_MESCO